MKKPKVGKTYTFVRKRGDTFEHTDFVRGEDGSASFVADGYISIYECDPDAWQHALDSLTQRGFIELGEAQQEGKVPLEWKPTPETSTLNSCDVVTPVPSSAESKRGSSAPPLPTEA
ncbi:MAG: hypothetical protein P4L99_21150 [Chthoniobacter sp.]|nr:hypothetical protein [Chthoniobacter sp.]